MARISVLTIVLLLAITGSAFAQQTEIERLRKAARSASRDAEAQAALGRAYLRAGQLKKAERTLKYAARLKRNTIEAQYEVITVKFASGDHKASRAACFGLAKKFPDETLTHVCMARAFLVWRRSSLAFEYLDKALKQDPRNVEALVALGDAHRMSGEFKKSEQAYQRALKADPNESRAYLGLGRLYVIFQKPDRALEVLRRGFEKDPTCPDIQLELGKLVQGEEQLKLFQSAAAGRPGWIDAQVPLAEALFTSGKIEEAEKVAADVLKRVDDRAEAYAVVGRAQAELKKYQGAEEALRHALKLVPNNFEAALALANVLAETDRPEDAFEQYRSAADLDPRGTRALVKAAQLGMRLGRKALAAGFLDRALARDPGDARVLALFGDVLVARGDRVKAREYYGRALKGRGEIDRERVKKALQQIK